MKIKVLGRMVAVERNTMEEKTKGGIILSEIAKEKSYEGTVTTVGKDVVEVKKGDKVIFAKYGGMDITSDDGKDYIVLDEKEIIAIRQ